MTMTPIAELRELHAKADSNGWTVDEDGDLCARVPTCWREDAWQDEQGRNNAALVVAAVNALPALLDLAERAEAAEQRCADMEKVLSDPTAVHLNMLRGGIAKPSPVNIWHLYGDEALLADMPESARALAQTGRG
ncbi:hypothetical protein [Sphingomonas crocodyli]|uniref:Uncharacterized protein n=1 Tax=Sphingomonas crocodyli TaxID=1979270 RepID=A0A437M855_9SPHN|nr:hypothetical protein [Sphingomonas crocodyli]RVT93746.1 hypothetical protein EOD43_07730 [Sphingomonas crocodyli]